MRTLSASEVKRRGILAIEELLDRGPVHILRNSRTACVAMSEEEFVRLTSNGRSKATQSAWDLLLSPARKGKTSRTAVDARVKTERDSWDRK